MLVLLHLGDDRVIRHLWPFSIKLTLKNDLVLATSMTVIILSAEKSGSASVQLFIHCQETAYIPASLVFPHCMCIVEKTIHQQQYMLLFY